MHLVIDAPTEQVQACERAIEEAKQELARTLDDLGAAETAEERAVAGHAVTAASEWLGVAAAMRERALARSRAVMRAG